MKRIIFKALLVGILMLINISVFGQSSFVPDSAYYLNSSSGTFSVKNTQYIGVQTKTWHINSSTQKPVKINFDVDIVENTDFLDIYAVTGSNEYLMLTITATSAGSISTVLPTGKAKVRFRMNCASYTYGGSSSRYDGFTVSFSVDNAIPNISVSDNAYVNQNLSVLGNVGIGTAANTNLYRLSVSGTNQYGIYSINNSTHSRSAYGIYSSLSPASNNNASLYGLYSTVSGTTTSKWAGYFNGGTVEVNGGVLKANGGLIVGDSSALFNGNVGIGTTAPAYKLDVNGTSRTTGNALFGGNVGIGTTSPAYKLDVSGIIRAAEVKIDTGGADFVFNDDYRLKPLPEVERFIKANKHLPEIPSAAEMKENEGMGIGEMQTKLLQKIEELTLYLIQQENTIQELKSEIRELKEK